MLNLERIEMTPAGIERGGLIATIPLAPLEETAVIQKEWSVTTKEFTSIVTDSLESISETGVTDNTELAQSTTSQNQHANQFNITGTVSGGIPIISGSTTSTFGAQNADSESATASRKHAVTLTEKASARVKKEHKVTISTTTVTGTQETTTRTLQNSSRVNPMRIDYFSLMRKWQVRLYRYGLRLTYDIVIPEPAGALRKIYADLADKKSHLGPFVFDLSPSDITNQKRPGEDKPHYLVLADQRKVTVPPYPEDRTLSVAKHSGLGGWSFMDLAFEVPEGYQIAGVLIDTQIGKGSSDSNVDVLGSAFTFIDKSHPIIARNLPLYVVGSTTLIYKVVGEAGIVSVDNPGKLYLEHATGRQTVTCFFDGPDQAWIRLTVHTVPTETKVAQWRADVWNALYNAAQTHYFAQQQEIAAEITQLEDQINNVDTLTLRPGRPMHERPVLLNVVYKTRTEG
jgi:hypothetical protein